MTTVGLLGGLGPESTIDYYRRILDAWERAHPGTPSPSIVIDSLDVGTGLRLVALPDRRELVEYLLASLRRLAGAGAGFIAMTANTAHVVFDELAARSAVPLLSIVEVCVAEARRRELRRLALLGTRFTMEGAFYPEVFSRHGITVVSPDEAERLWLHDRYVGELLKGNFRDETRQGVVALVARLRDAHGLDGVILGGTELPLLLGAPVIAGLPTLDTTALHVAAIVERLERGEHVSPVASASALSLLPVATVRSPYRDRTQIPKGPGAQHHAEGVLEFRPELEAGLTDIEGFSHLYVVWVFDRAEGYDLLAKPPTDDRPHGVFATRAPRRPNPIGLTVVELLGRDGPRLRVRGVDMLDGTPILDVKPYLSSVPAERLRRGWLAEAEGRGFAQGLPAPGVQ